MELFSVKSLTQLDKLYNGSDVKRKRQIVGSIFPEKFVFDGLGYRTEKINEAVELIWSVDKGLAENRNGQTETNFNLSILVHQSGVFSNHFMNDLKLLANVN